MSEFILQSGTPLDWADMNYNLQLIQAKYLDSANNAAIAIAAANFKGSWSGLAGALAVPSSVYHSGKFWLLLSDLADVAAKEPGVDAEWLEIITGNVMGPASATAGNIATLDATGKVLSDGGVAPAALMPKAGGTMTGPIAQADGTAALPSYTFSGSNNAGMWSPSANVLAWSTAGLERLRIDSAGMVGIGGASGGARLQVTGTDFLGAAFTQERTGVAKWSSIVNVSGGIVWRLGDVTSGADKVTIDAGGNLLSLGGGLGYGTGAGGAVTQGTSRTTGVTLNKPSGQITLVSAAGSASWQSFTLTNSAIALADGVVVTQRTGADLYEIHVTGKAAGSCRISFRTTGGTTTEQPVFDFQVIKGATS